MIPNDFHFLRPLWLLALLPLAGLLWGLVRRQGAAGAWSRVCDPSLLKFLSDAHGETAAARWPVVLAGVGGALAIVALAGPVWQQLPQPVYRGQAARVVVLSLADSMNAADLPPSRLARARFKVLDLLGAAEEGQTGLVVFAGEPFVVSPLTDDAATIAAMVPVLDTDMMPASGRNLAPALEKAGELLDQAAAGHGQVVVFADGLDDHAAALQQATKLAQRYRVSVIGVGTADGVPVTDGEGGFKRDAGGAIALTRLEEGTLRDVAAAGGGEYRRLTAGGTDLEQVLAAPGEFDYTRRAEQGRTADQWREEGPWLLIPLLLVAAFAFRRGWILAVVLVVQGLPQDAWAFGWRDLWQTSDQQAAEALSEGRAGDAAGGFTDPAWRATAHYRAGDFETAAGEFEGLESPDAHYNRGNALARGGHLGDALAAYRQVLEQQPDHADARYNMEMVEKLLKQQQSARQQDGQSADDQQQGQGRDGDGSDGQGEGGVSQDQNQGQDQEQERQHQGQDGHDQEGSRDQGSRDQESRDQGGDGQGDKGQEAQGPENPGSGGGQEQPQPGGDAGPPEDRSAAAGEQGSTAPDASKDEGAGNPGDHDDGEARQGRPPRPADAGGEAPAQAAGETSGDTRNAAGVAEGDGKEGETAQAMEQWLRRIPDDPGGLLRRKFMLEHYRRQQAAGTR